MTDRIAPVSAISSLVAGGVSAPAVGRVAQTGRPKVHQHFAR